ncbi:MAG: leucine zipper domain-containing protein [Tepidisphaeraceae bacterium]
MPLKVSLVSEQRWALCHAIRLLGRPVAVVCREYGVSRKTAYKWLKVFDARGSDDTPRGSIAAGASTGVLPAGVDVLRDRSRRPRSSPRRLGAVVEARVLAERDRHGWGPRKVHAILRREALACPEALAPLPCLRTVANVLRRHGRTRPGEPAPPPPQRFERDRPNALWQLDHKGPVEVNRQTLLPLCVVDAGGEASAHDHSRYALAFEPLTDRTMARTFAALWEVFGEVGLPEQILCDNAFGTTGTSRPVGLSWWDAQLVRLGIEPIHGRPYHPQTQGKVERLNGTFASELNVRQRTDLPPCAA